MYRRGDEGAHKDVIFLDLCYLMMHMYVNSEGSVAVDWKLESIGH